MQGEDETAARMRIRQTLLAALKELDHLRDAETAIAVNVAVESLNRKLGLETSQADLAHLRGKLFLGGEGE